MPKGRQDIATDFHKFLVGFLAHKDFKKFKGTPIFLTGESYAGHYIPYIANELYYSEDADINLKGVAIGNGFMSPVYIYASYPKFAFKAKKISEDRFEYLQPRADLCSHLITVMNRRLGHQTREVCDILYSETMSDPSTGKKLFYEYDVDLGGDFEYPDYFCTFLNDPEVARRLGNKKESWQGSNSTV